MPFPRCGTSPVMAGAGWDGCYHVNGGLRLDVLVYCTGVIFCCAGVDNLTGCGFWHLGYAVVMAGVDSVRLRALEGDALAVEFDIQGSTSWWILLWLLCQRAKEKICLFSGPLMNITY
jgi:hypothetical protein